MPRPLRIEFENAWYHVSNRGAAGRPIFSSPNHSALFIDILQECIACYGIEVHSFCFLSNAYHLLIRTPQANLSKAMRQLNGIYTQRFNKDQNSEGPLFRGRYRAIILEEQYILPISRFIDLQPVKHQLVDNPLNYKWSSYRAHIGRPVNLPWLHLQEIEQRCDDYAGYVQLGVDEEVTDFYRKKKQSPILGCFQFKHQLLKPTQRSGLRNRTMGPSMDTIMQATAQYFDVSTEQLRLSRRGQVNIPRSVAIYLSRKLGHHILVDIAAEYSGISHAAVGTTVKRFQQLLEKDTSLQQSVECIIDSLQQRSAPNPSTMAEVA